MAKASADIEIGEEKVVEIFEAAADAKTVGGPASPSSKPEVRNWRLGQRVAEA